MKHWVWFLSFMVLAGALVWGIRLESGDTWGVLGAWLVGNVALWLAYIAGSLYERDRWDK